MIAAIPKTYRGAGVPPVRLHRREGGLMRNDDQIHKEVDNGKYKADEG